MDGLLLVLCVAALWLSALAFWKVSMEIDGYREQDEHDEYKERLGCLLQSSGAIRDAGQKVVVGDFNRRKRGDEVKWQ
jgi:hypothetical protein